MAEVFQQFYLECLAHASYLVGDDDSGDCAIVDPRRDVDEYVRAADERGLTIRWILETHLHADFVSGHLELARRTGATIAISHRANAGYEHRALHDGDVLRLGDVAITAWETPGHTPESMCFVISTADGPPTKVLTGDTLFIGDVGRPDLAGGAGYTSEQMASMMYDTLRERLATLPDDCEVFPGHGAGSACGRAMSSALSCTIGRQRNKNWAFAEQTREEFVAELTHGLDAPPAYFPHDVATNRRGADDLPDDVPVLTVDDFAGRRAGGAVVLDVRPGAAFLAGHVAGSLWVGLDGKFAAWCGAVVPTGVPLLVVVDDAAQRTEVVTRLGRVGLDDVVGVLVGVDAWREAGGDVASIPSTSVDDLGAHTVLDVRQTAEHDDGHVPGAATIPLRELRARVGDAPAGPLAVICESGYRSLVACSVLAAAGRHDVVNVTGGTAAWRAAGKPVESSVPAS